MKNFILGITSFIMAFMFLSQVALAADTLPDGGDPKHTTSAPGEDKNLPINEDTKTTEATVAATGIECPTGQCPDKSAPGRLGDKSNPGAAKSGAADPTKSSTSDAK